MTAKGNFRCKEISSSDKTRIVPHILSSTTYLVVWFAANRSGCPTPQTTELSLLLHRDSSQLRAHFLDYITRILQRQNGVRQRHFEPATAFRTSNLFIY